MTAETIILIARDGCNGLGFLRGASEVVQSPPLPGSAFAKCLAEHAAGQKAQETAWSSSIATSSGLSAVIEALKTGSAAEAARLLATLEDNAIRDSIPDRLVELAKGFRKGGQSDAAKAVEAQLRKAVIDTLDAHDRMEASRTYGQLFTRGAAEVTKLVGELQQMDLGIAAERPYVLAALYSANGDMPAAVQAIRESARLVQESANFSLAIDVANLATEIDDAAALATLDQAKRLLPWNVSSISGMRAPPDAVTIVRTYARLGEFRLAREAAERVGMPLIGRSPPVTSETNIDFSDMATSDLYGDGVLGGYRVILDAELARRDPADNIEKPSWAVPAPLYRTRVTGMG